MADLAIPSNTRRNAALASSTLALAVGVLGSGAANVAWTWELGPVRVVAGLFATALVPISLHLWPRVPVTGKPTRAIRAVVMTYICLAAALVNLAHSAQLLTTDPGMPRPAMEDMVLAVLLITAVEAVMVMATLAKRPPKAQAPAVSVEQLALVFAVTQMAGAVKPAPKTRPRRDERPTSVAVAPKPRTAPAETLPPIEWARLNWPVSAKEIELGTGVSKGYSFKLRDAVSAERENAS